MPILGPLHPAIVHAPVALILVAASFELVGRATDLAWWRKAAFAMLVFGTVAAWLAVWSGTQAEEPAEDQGVPQEVIEAHENVAKLSAWLATGAVMVRTLAGRLGSAGAATGVLGLLLHLAAAGAVGVAAFRGGTLVFEHGAGVKVDGQPVKSGAAPEPEAGRD